MDHAPIFIDKAVLHQRLREIATANDLQILAWLLL